MNKRSLLLSSLLFIHLDAYAANPASKSYVDQQIAGLQAQISAVSSVTASTWNALCPEDQSLSSTAGCQPNCTGSQQSACTQILTATNLLGQFALPAVNSNSIIAFSFTPTSALTTEGPVMTPPSAGGVTAQCMSVTVNGQPFTQVINTTNSGGSTTQTFTYQDSAVTLTQGGGNATLSIYAHNLDTNYSASTNTYYVICSAFTVTNHVPSPANAAGITASWT